MILFSHKKNEQKRCKKKKVNQRKAGFISRQAILTICWIQTVSVISFTWNFIFNRRNEKQDNIFDLEARDNWKLENRSTLWEEELGSLYGRTRNTKSELWFFFFIFFSVNLCYYFCLSLFIFIIFFEKKVTPWRFNVWRGEHILWVLNGVKDLAEEIFFNVINSTPCSWMSWRMNLTMHVSICTYKPKYWHQ